MFDCRTYEDKMKQTDVSHIKLMQSSTYITTTNVPEYFSFLSNETACIANKNI